MHSTQKTILFTAIKTVVLLLLVVMLISMIFSFAKPQQAGDFFYTVGLKGISARATLRHARQTNEIEDYYTTLVRAYDAKSIKISAYAASAMLSHESGALFTETQYNNFVKSVDTDLGVSTGSTNQYVKMVFAYSQMRINKGVDETGALWNRVKEFCKGTGLYYYYNSVCPITGYINGIIDSNKTDDATIFRVLFQLKEFDEHASASGYPYWRTTKDNTMESINDNYVDAHEYMLQDAKRLIQSKKITLDKTKAYAQTTNDPQKYIEAFNYWSFYLN